MQHFRFNIFLAESRKGIWHIRAYYFVIYCYSDVVIPFKSYNIN